MDASINAVFDGNSENAFHEKEHPNGTWGVSAGYQYAVAEKQGEYGEYGEKGWPYSILKEHPEPHNAPEPPWR